MLAKWFHLNTGANDNHTDMGFARARQLAG
jgi:hypothetical protein